MKKGVSLVEKILICLTFVFSSLAVTSVFQNAVITPKIIAFSFCVALLVLLFGIRIIVERKFEFNIGSYDLPIIFLVAVTLASALIKTPNKIEAFFFPGTALVLISGAIFYFLLNQTDKQTKNAVAKVIISLATFISLLSLINVSGLASKISFLPAFMKDRSFTLIGGNYATISYLIPILFLTTLIGSFEEGIAKKFFYYTAGIIITIGIAVNLYNILPGKDTSIKIPSLATSWSIAIDTLKESPLLGVGPANYLSAFNKFKPIKYNTTPLWEMKFSGASNFVLTLLTEIGIMGLIGFLTILPIYYKDISKEFKEAKSVNWGGYVSNSYSIPLGVALAITFFFNISVPFLLILFAFLSFSSAKKKISLDLKGTASPEAGISRYIPGVAFSLPLFVLTGLYLFYAANAISAEYTFNKSLNFAVKGDGIKAYDTAKLATSKNPKVDRYHTLLSQISLALADSIIKGAGEKKLTDEERTTVSQLIEQAIAEGKSTVATNPQKSANWAFLGSIYRAIIPMATGASGFAIQTYSQAIALDPLDPNLRIILGGIYYSQGNLDDAIDIFKTAVMAKPDHANARYNLAVAYRDKGEIERAITEMTTVLSLVDRNSNDYEVAKKELESLQAKKPKKEEAKVESETLTTPTEVEEKIVPPIELPQEAQPPTSTPIPSPLP